MLRKTTNFVIFTQLQILLHENKTDNEIYDTQSNQYGDPHFLFDNQSSNKISQSNF